MGIKKLFGQVTLALIITIWGTNFATADLTKQDVEEVRKIIKEEIQILREEMNARFESIERNISANFSWLYILLASIIALNGAMVGAVVWLARQDKPITQKHYEKILAREDKLEEELSVLTRKLELHLSTAHAS